MRKSTPTIPHDVHYIWKAARAWLNPRHVMLWCFMTTQLQENEGTNLLKLAIERYQALTEEALLEKDPYQQAMLNHYIEEVAEQICDLIKHPCKRVVRQFAQHPDDRRVMIHTTSNNEVWEGKIEDVTRDIITAVFGKLVKVTPDPEKDIVGLVVRIAQRRLTDEFRAFLRAKKHGTEPLTDKHERTIRSPSSVDDDVVEADERQQQREALQQCLNKLTTDERNIIAWRIDDVPFGEIAERLGANVGAVRKRYSRIHKAIQRDLGDNTPPSLQADKE